MWKIRSRLFAAPVSKTRSSFMQVGSCYSIPVTELIFIYIGQELANNRTVASYNIGEEFLVLVVSSTLELFVS